VTGHDFLKKQWKVAEDEIFQKGDLSYGTALLLVMAAMGALPIVSNLIKGGKLSMKVYNKALVKVSKAGPAGVKAAQKAKGAVGDAIKTSSKTATTGRTQKTGAAAGKIKGLDPAFSPKTGAPYGVFVDKKGNSYVMIVDSAKRKPVVIKLEPGVPPGSKYGEIGKKLEQLSPDGRATEKLKDYFGPFTRGKGSLDHKGRQMTGGTDFETWRKGYSRRGGDTIF